MYTWSIFGGFIFWYFISLFISQLAVPHNEPLLNTLDELHFKTNLKLYTFNSGSIYEKIIRWKKKNQQNKYLFEKIFEPYLIDITIPYNEIVHLIESAIKNGKDVGFLETDQTMEIMETQGNFSKCLVLDNEITPNERRNVGWMFPQSSMLQPIFDHYMFQLYEKGHIHKLALKPDTQVCESNDLVPVNFSFVLILFVVLSLGIILSSLTLILEKLGINTNAL